MSKNETRIAIVGAGLGGLTLARMLQMRGFAPVVYERESSRDARTQGGSLDMHVESGQYALREAGLEREFRANITPGGEETRVLDKTARVLFEQNAPAGFGGRPEIDRATLRSILLDSLRPNTIRWGRGAKSVTSSLAGGARLTLEDGEMVDADLIVGADGASSRIRPYLSDASPAYLGVSFIEIGIADARAEPELAALVGRGSFFALSDAKGFLAHLTSDHRIHLYVGFRCEEDWLEKSGIPFDRPQDARAALCKQFSDWAQPFHDLILRADDAIVPRRIESLPTGHRWATKKGVTLLGDAAHLMSPFAGEGANLAMLDATDLATAITSAITNANAFEEAMCARAAIAAEESAKNLELCFSEGAAETLAAMMNSH